MWSMLRSDARTEGSTTWSTWSAVINLTSRAGELGAGPDDRDRVAGKRALALGVVGEMVIFK